MCCTEYSPLNWYSSGSRPMFNKGKIKPGSDTEVFLRHLCFIKSIQTIFSTCAPGVITFPQEKFESNMNSSSLWNSLTQNDRVAQKSHSSDPEDALLRGQEEFPGKCDFDYFFEWFVKYLLHIRTDLEMCSLRKLKTMLFHSFAVLYE